MNVVGSCVWDDDSLPDFESEHKKRKHEHAAAATGARRAPEEDVVKWVVDTKSGQKIPFAQSAQSGLVHCGRVIMHICGTVEKKEVQCESCLLGDCACCGCVCHVLQQHYSSRACGATLLQSESQG